MRTRFIALSLLLYTGHGIGADDAMREALKDCTKNQLSMTLCAQHESNVAETRLNQVYRCVLREIKDPDWVKLIREAQRGWVKYRESQCAHYAGGPQGPGSGSMWPMLYGGCKAAMAKQRTDELVNLGDGSIDACKLR